MKNGKTSNRIKALNWLLPAVLLMAVAWLGNPLATVTAQRTLPGTLPTGTLPTLDTVVRDQSAVWRATDVRAGAHLGSRLGLRTSAAARRCQWR
jgi:hypothetical protein